MVNGPLKVPADDNNFPAMPATRPAGILKRRSGFTLKANKKFNFFKE
jgi:hypothetical protein